MSEEDIKKLQSTGGEHLAATEKNILGNQYVATSFSRSRQKLIAFLLQPGKPYRLCY